MHLLSQDHVIHTQETPDVYSEDLFFAFTEISIYQDHLLLLVLVQDVLFQILLFTMDGLPDLSERLHLLWDVNCKVNNMLMKFVRNILVVDIEWLLIMMVFILMVWIVVVLFMELGKLLLLNIVVDGNFGLMVMFLIISENGFILEIKMVTVGINK